MGNGICTSLTRMVTVFVLTFFIFHRLYVGPDPCTPPVAGPIFETKNLAIFLERFFGRGITAENSFLGQ